MSNDCISCQARPGTTTDGLCQPCHDDLRFVVRPTAHREIERRADATDPAIRELERQGIAVIQIWPESNDLWICDFCNTQIPVEDDIALVPVLGTWALCPSCVTTIPYWPEAWIHPTPRACPCDACQLPLVRARQQLARHSRSSGIEDLGIA
jgi:hypothetical protein